MHPKLVGFPPAPRYLHVAAVVYDKMYIHGGMANNLPFEDFWMFDIGMACAFINRC